MPERKVIIAGGSGLIGHALIAEFISHDYSVTILTRNPQSLDRLPDKVAVLGWRELKAGDHDKMWESTSAIINLAGESIAGDGLFSLRWTPKRKKAILESRLKAGEAISQAVRTAKHKPDVLIQASAVGYYGMQRRDDPLDETSPAGEDFLAEVCRAWEASTGALGDIGVRRLVVRIGVVYSYAGGALPRQALPFRFFVGGPLGDGRQWVSWIHITDIARAVRFLVEKSSCRGIYNLCSPQPVTNAEFSNVLGESLHRPSLIPLPGFVLRFFFGEAASILLGGQRVIPKRLLDDGFHFQYSSIKEALFNLG